MTIFFHKKWTKKNIVLFAIVILFFDSCGNNNSLTNHNWILALKNSNLPEFHNFIKFHHQTVVYVPNHYFRYWNWNPNWPILLADSVTDTETTSQRENLVTDSVGHSFNHKHWIFESMIWRLFLKIWVYFPAHKNLYPPKKWKKYSFGFRKKSFGSDTEIGPWFRSPILKSGFGRAPNYLSKILHNQSHDNTVQ